MQIRLDPNFDRDHPECGVHPEDDELPRDDEPHDIEFALMTAEEAAGESTAAAERCERLVGVNGKTCHCLIADLKSGCWKVSGRRIANKPFV